MSSVPSPKSANNMAAAEVRQTSFAAWGRGTTRPWACRMSGAAGNLNC